MNRITLNRDEIAQIEALLREITLLYDWSEDPELLKQATVYAQELPRRLRAFLNEFRLVESRSGACIISGFPVDDEQIGRTPEHWNQRMRSSPTLEKEILFALCGSLLGDLIAWATQQDGYLIHDVLPVKGYENSQISIGSEQAIEWHTEDAFHPHRGDYVGLMCLRNPDRIATTLGSVSNVEIDPVLRSRLFEEIFVIRPDNSHDLGSNTRTNDTEGVRSAFERIQRMAREPEKVAIFFGDQKQPYLRLDPYFMDEVVDEHARSALKALVRSIDDILEEIVLEPGDILLVDNFRAVHGRKPFKARHDGKDRWLKRINVTRDLRKSRSLRAASEARIIA